VPVAAVYCILIFVFAYPLTRHPASRVVESTVPEDTDLFVWTLGWNLHRFGDDPFSIFDANIYYPLKDTLAFSENLIGGTVMAAPFVWFTGNLVFGMNAVLILSSVLCGLGTYELARRVGLPPFAAILAGMIFMLAPTRLSRLGQFHITTIQWVPFCLACLYGYLDSGRRRDAWGVCGFLAAQVATSGHGAMFAAVAVVMLVAWRVALGQPITSMIRLRDLAVPAVLLAAVDALFLAPYRLAAAEVTLERSVGESLKFSPNAASFLASPTHLHTFLLSLLPDRLQLTEPSAFIFPGYLTLALALAAIVLNPLDRGLEVEKSRVPWAGFARLVEVLLIIGVAGVGLISAVDAIRVQSGVAPSFTAQELRAGWLTCGVLAGVRAIMAMRVPINSLSRVRRAPRQFWERREQLREDPTWFFGVLSLVALWLSLGPSFVLYRLVHDLPGVSLVRVPTRFVLVSLLGLAIMAGIGFQRLVRRLQPRTRVALSLIAVTILLVEFFAAPIATKAYAVDVPAVDWWLATRPKPFVVAEVPVVQSSDHAGADRRESLYMLHSTAHWQKTIHGYSGVLPVFHRRLYEELMTFPDEKSLKSLASIGVTYVVVHPDLYPASEWPRVAARLEQQESWLRLEHTAEGARVYSLRHQLHTER
jgi:hypothetical protein